MASTLNHRKALLVLNGLKHVGPIMLRRLLDTFDYDPVAVLAGDHKKLLSVKGVGEKAAKVLTHWSEHFDISREIERMKASNIRFIAQSDDAFPPLLKEMYDPPIGFCWKGECNIDRPCIAIVGSRRATLYGHSIARKFASALSQLGFRIVSGMARGIDTAAHEGALEVGGQTVAVLGCGLDIVYPPENLDLYKQIALTGAAASEFPFGRRADRQSFPMRNRLVAGMFKAVIVVESAVAGGSMITARFAGEQGRQIMAALGRIDQSSSGGCHQLIRDGETMVTSVDDILEELRYTRSTQTEVELPMESEASQFEFKDLERQVLDCFRGGELYLPDQISQRLNRSSAQVSATLMGLELKRLVAERADGYFEVH